MSKERNVIEFYVLCDRLKNTLRTGWKDWHVSSDRVESIAEHIYGVQMLAIAMKYEYNYDIDIYKVIIMLAIHEIGETIIGDLTIFDISREEKKKKEREAVHKLLTNFASKDVIEKLFLEFEERKTKEALFAHWCDKLECALQCKLYDERGLVDLNNQEDNKSFHDEQIQRLLKDNNNSWSTMWLKLWKEKCNYDENFNVITDYAINNEISENKKKILK